MILLKKNKMHVRTGDLVKVISGSHRGAEGKVLRVIREKNQVLIENVRMIKKHLGRSQDRPQGEIIEREGPIHVSNVKKSNVDSVALGATSPSKIKSTPKNPKVKKDSLEKKSKKAVEPKQEE